MAIMKINIGPKVDLFRKEDGSYRFVDYFNRFTQDYGKKAIILEFHLSLSNVNDKDKFSEDLDNIAEFSQKNNVKAIAFHYPNGDLLSTFPAEAAWIEKSLKLINKSKVRDDQVMPSIEESKELLYRLIDVIGDIGFSSAPVLVTHKAGLQLEKEFFKTRTFEELAELRKDYLEELLKEHQEILYHCGDRIRFGLENVPTVGWNNNEAYLCEHAFEHFEERLSLGGVYVLDTAHAAMSRYHQHQDDVKFKSMESVEQENNPSLVSLEEHIKISGTYTKWMHLADARGVLLEDEGLTLGVEGSIINWPNVMRAIEQYVAEPNLILEIVDSHKDYDCTIGDSLRYLKREGFIE